MSFWGLSFPLSIGECPFKSPSVLGLYGPWHGGGEKFEGGPTRGGKVQTVGMPQGSVDPVEPWWRPGGALVQALVQARASGAPKKAAKVCNRHFFCKDSPRASLQVLPKR